MIAPELPPYLLPHVPALRAIGQTLRQSRRVLVIPHQRPDGDCLGAATAVLALCQGWGIDADCFCNDAPPPYLSFLPHVHRVTTDRAALASRYDAVFVVDADVSFAGVSGLVADLPHGQLLNLDHHATNTGRGPHVAAVLPEASSVCEVLYFAARYLWLAPLEPDLATSLLCGIATDTGHFSNPATASPALEAAAGLLRAGARWDEVGRWTRRTRPLGVWQLWGTALQRLRYHPDRRLAVTFIRHREVLASGADGVEGVANFLGATCAVPTILVLREQGDGTIKGSLRTTDDGVDVAALAAAFGGGGHRKASGFVIPGRIVERDGRWVVESSHQGAPLLPLA